MNILQTTDLKKYYGTEPNITKALDGVTLSIEEGEFVAIVGTSGSGKSTLLNMMGGLDTPTSGSIKVKGKELSKLKDEQLTIFRRRNIGFIFQNWGDSVLFPHYFCGCRNLHIFYCNHRQHETSENSCKYFSCCGFTLYGGKYKELPRS